MREQKGSSGTVDKETELDNLFLNIKEEAEIKTKKNEEDAKKAEEIRQKEICEQEMMLRQQEIYVIKS